MKKFLQGLIVFLIPLIIFLSIPTYILWHSKENFYKVDKVLAGKDKYLIGYYYDEVNYHYLKWTYLHENERKSIWALGSSRVLAFRRDMFDSSFYNLGFTIYNIRDFRKFLNAIPEDKHPKYLIIGLDEWMFNDAWQVNMTPQPREWQHEFTFYPELSKTYKSVYKELFAGRMTHKFPQPDKSIRTIGINAIYNGIGVRDDGSMSYGTAVDMLMNNDPKYVDYQFSSTYARMKSCGVFFEHGQEVSAASIVVLDELLKYCKEQQIEVVAFLPPFADQVYNKMIESNNYGYLKNVYPTVKPLFDKYHYEVYDFSHVGICQSSDNEMTDGYHAGEVAYQRMLIDILKSGSILNRVARVEKLEADLAKRKNRYVVYDY